MGSAPAWPLAGAARFSRGAARRAVSSSRFRFRRSTEAPDGFGASAAIPSACERVRHSPLPHPWPAPQVRASRYDLDRQSNGPATDGTDSSQIPILRGGPQSFAAAPARHMAARSSAPSARLGPGDQDPSGGVRRQLRSTTGTAPQLARNRSRRQVRRAPSPAASARPCFAHPRVPAWHLPSAAAELPLYPIVLSIRTGSSYSPWRTQGHLARRSPSCPLSSISSGRVRPCPLTP